MAGADIDGAREAADAYLEWIKPRWPELAGRSTKLTYSVELLWEKMCVSVTPEGTSVSFIPAGWLVQSAATSPYAYQVYTELRALGSQLIGSGADTIRGARVERPKAQGNREQNGVRDFIFSVLWVRLQEFGLPKENKVRKGVRPITPSIGVVISEAVQTVIGETIAPRTVLAAVLKTTKN